MSPEGIAALSAVCVAIVGAGPAYLGLSRRVRGAVSDEGTATREAVAASVQDAVSRLEGRLDGMREDIRDVRDWQTSHTAEHMLIQHNRNED
ncbi:hypothetical protein [Streptomyces sp. Isolate_219]|uniref:hypothetical protein n=1 Tax=Streptomyces sp. Isolate_219 TaxID=2950110 RepID=UPI0021C5D898|nr:hypothetical protein [Streptomyces sp. Isolate_219]MCR8576457.1 hypothetical protein [Streptomyces sp. Isolate_219]